MFLRYTVKLQLENKERKTQNSSVVSSSDLVRRLATLRWSRPGGQVHWHLSVIIKHYHDAQPGARHVLQRAAAINWIDFAFTLSADLRRGHSEVQGQVRKDVTQYFLLAINKNGHMVPRARYLRI
ncbi:hypothetical protein ACJJTC_018391 [Scirpophaga incertulas]